MLYVHSSKTQYHSKGKIMNILKSAKAFIPAMVCVLATTFGASSAAHANVIESVTMTSAGCYQGCGTQTVQANTTSLFLGKTYYTFAQQIDIFLTSVGGTRVDGHIYNEATLGTGVPGDSWYLQIYSASNRPATCTGNCVAEVAGTQDFSAMIKGLYANAGAGTWNSASYVQAFASNNSNFQLNITSRASDVPEPGSLALMGLAFAGMAAVKRRKAK
jgi:hypothetical protein